ncbi:transmembrane protein 51b [Salarias fasciatus]|uniref:Transmembrane protein 51-like n=1 Tax=Salarias fasciatus TaxID=181472 RepID=A0A672FDF4_SALFA|nr:transmembrane protein 51-like [Salarias fasciatus]
MSTCRNLCGSNSRSSRTSGSGAHYALCALGVGLIALGIVMIVWTVIPLDGEDSGSSGNNTSVPGSNDEEDEESERTKSSSVALVLVGVGVAILFLSICLGVRSKRRASERRSQRGVGVPFMDHVVPEQEETVDPTAYNVPSYDEVVGSQDYPVRQSNLRNSTSQLPSYEDILAAVENEGREPAENGAPSEAAAAGAAAAAQPAATEPDASGLSARPSLPARSASRASRLLRPLRVRRHKSDKLHLKDFRLQIRTPTQNPVTIEPITPPPGYENKMPELQ